MKGELVKNYLIIIFLFANLCFGQNVYFGIKGGLHLSQFIVNGSDGKYKPAVGISAGGELHLPLTTELFFQPEILLTTKCIRYKNDYRSGHDTAIYLDIPATLGMQIKNLNLYLGPRISILLGGRYKYTYEYKDWNGKITKETISDNYEIDEFYPDLGITCGVETKMGNLLVGGKFEMDFFNFDPNWDPDWGKFLLLSAYVGLPINF